MLLLSPTMTKAIFPRRVIMMPTCLFSSVDMDEISLKISLVAILWRGIFLWYNLVSLFTWLDLRPDGLPWTLSMT